jgi:hypothetical protein
MCLGLKKAATTPTPSAQAPAPEPATVVTASEEGSTRRITCAAVATKSAPAPSTATPQGPSTAAAVPTPFAEEAAPVPTYVVTKPEAVQRRTRWLLVSAT